MEKSRAFVVFLVALAATAVQMALGSDPDLTTDLGINSTSATDFTFTGFRDVLYQTVGSGTATPNPAQFNMGLPGLTGLGLSVVFFQFGAESQVNPHTHPRATEVFFVLDGTVDVGFVDTANTLFKTTLYKGDLFVFPKGLLHFQRNNQKATAAGISTLSGQNPGILQANLALFTSSGTGLPDNVLSTAFGTDDKTVELIKKALSSSGTPAASAPSPSYTHY